MRCDCAGGEDDTCRTNGTRRQEGTKLEPTQSIPRWIRLSLYEVRHPHGKRERVILGQRLRRDHQPDHQYQQPRQA